MTHIILNFTDSDDARANVDRIEGVVARAEDDVRARGRFIHVSTMQPGSFVDAYLAEGFDASISIQP